MKKKILRQPYIKPTRYMHDSGYRMFEVGYILKMSDKNKVLKKEVLGHSDHIFQDYMMMIDKHPFCLNMDLTVDGYIRFFVHDKNLCWAGDMALSSSELTLSPTPSNERKE